MADGKIIIETDISVKESERRLNDLKETAEQSGNSISNSMKSSADKVAREWDRAKASYDSSAREMIDLTRQLEDAQEALKVSESFGLWDIEGITYNKQLIEEINAELSKTSKLHDRNTLALENTGIKAEDLSEKIKTASSGGDKLSNSFKKASVEANKTSVSAKGISDGVSSGVKKLGKYALALFSIRSAYMFLRRLSSAWLNSDDAGAKQVKANIEAISGALSNALAPVITYIANLVMTVVGYANALLKAFFGVDLFAKKVSKNTAKTGGSIKKATKEMKRFNAQFDTAEVISSDINDNMDNMGGGGGMDMPAPIIPTPDVSGIMKALNGVKDFFLGIWNDPAVQRAFQNIATIGKNTFDMIASVGANVWRNWVLTFEEVLPHLQRGFASVLEVYSLMLEDMANATTKWFPIITEKLNSFVDSVFDTFRPIVVFMAQVWADVWGIILKLWKKHGQPLLDGFMSFIANTIDIFNDIWAIIDTIIAPILDMFQSWWDDTLKDVVEDVMDFVAELVLLALAIYNNFISPILQFLLKHLQPVFATVFGLIGGILTAFLNIVTSIVGLVVKAFKGLIQILGGIFSGDWKKIWQGAVNIVEAIFGAIVGVVKLPINFMIDMLNGFIRGLNRIKIPSWIPGIGGKGINISPIPRLAKGGVLRSETLNIAGEYAGARTNPEIVTPQNIMAETFEGVLSRLGSFGNGSQTLNLILNGKEIASAVNEQSNRDNIIRNGGMPLDFI